MNTYLPTPDNLLAYRIIDAVLEFSNFVAGLLMSFSFIELYRFSIIIDYPPTIKIFWTLVSIILFLFLYSRGHIYTEHFMIFHKLLGIFYHYYLCVEIHISCYVYIIQANTNSFIH